VLASLSDVHIQGNQIRELQINPSVALLGVGDPLSIPETRP